MAQQETKTQKTAASINLDAIDAAASERKPFTAQVGGRDYQLTCTNDIDYRELIANARLQREDPEAAIRQLLKSDDVESFFKNKISNRMLDEMFKAYNAYYGLPAAPGEAPASPGS